MARNNWTREETIIAFNVYCKIPFKSSHKTNPTIIKYAKIIGRSPSALNMKIGNFGRLDPELKRQGITGLKNGSKLDEEVWEEFHGNWEELAFKSELLIAKFQDKNIEDTIELNVSDLPIGMDKMRLVKTRVNQSFFRSTVLSSYNQKCCITGLSIPQLLIASHIIPWKENKERLNPRNGLCLNALHDRAFDKGYITVTPDFKVKLSPIFAEYKKDNSISDLLLKYDNLKITLPDRFLPSQEFLDYHYHKIFKK